MTYRAKDLGFTVLGLGFRVLGSKPFKIDLKHRKLGHEGVQRHPTASGFVLVEYEPPWGLTATSFVPDSV